MMSKKTLRQFRREKDMTQEELASLAKVTPRTISKYETKPSTLKNAKYETISRIAKILGVSVDDIFLN